MKNRILALYLIITSIATSAIGKEFISYEVTENKIPNPIQEKLKRNDGIKIIFPDGKPIWIWAEKQNDLVKNFAPNQVTKSKLDITWSRTPPEEAKSKEGITQKQVKTYGSKWSETTLELSGYSIVIHEDQLSKKNLPIKVTIEKL